jgi:hypothetical protein
MLVVAPTPLEELIVEGMPSRSVAALTTTAKRAQTLTADGYTMVRGEKPSIYLVTKPPKVNKATGEILEEYPPYTVNAVEGTCDCPQFAYHGACKHERAARVAVREALELLLGKDGAK